MNDIKEIAGLPDAKRLMEDIPNNIVNCLGIIIRHEGKVNTGVWVTLENADT